MLEHCGASDISWREGLTEVRNAHGIYCKQGCGDILAEKMHLLEGPIAILSEWMAEYPERSSDICTGRIENDAMRWNSRLACVVSR